MGKASSPGNPAYIIHLVNQCCFKIVLTVYDICVEASLNTLIFREKKHALVLFLV